MAIKQTNKKKKKSRSYTWVKANQFMFYLRDTLFNYADFPVKLKIHILSSKMIKRKKIKHAELYNT